MKITKELRTYIDEQGRTQVTLARSEKLEDELCDFCSGQERPYKEYKCKDFDPGDGFESLGNWNACPKCAELIDADDREGLLERVMIMAAGMLRYVPGVRDSFIEIFNLFLENRIK